MRLSARWIVVVIVGKRQSRPWIVSDEPWSLIEPFLPGPGAKQVEGRPRVPDRQALRRILLVLHTGIQWECLPQELGFGSGMTCWRRLAAWNEAGVWDQLHALLLKKLRSKNQLDWSRAVIDSSHVRAARRGPKADPARSTAHDRAASTTPHPPRIHPPRDTVTLG
jgi:transposase